jgi:hypothetical protein
MTFSIPMVLRVRMTEDKLTRKISGMAVAGNPEKDFSV